MPFTLPPPPSWATKVAAVIVGIGVISSSIVLVGPQIKPIWEYSKCFIYSCRPENYSIHYRTDFLSKNGKAKLKSHNAEFVIYDQVGGCGTNDVAKCVTDQSGNIKSYIKDSCSDVGKYGSPVSHLNSASHQQDRGYKVECKIVEYLYD